MTSTARSARGARARPPAICGRWATGLPGDRPSSGSDLVVGCAKRTNRSDATRRPPAPTPSPLRLVLSPLPTADIRRFRQSDRPARASERGGSETLWHPDRALMLKLDPPPYGRRTGSHGREVHRTLRSDRWRGGTAGSHPQRRQCCSLAMPPIAPRLMLHGGSSDAWDRS